MKCQNCGTEHSANFCPNCGAPAVQPPQPQHYQQQPPPYPQPPTMQPPSKKKNGCVKIGLIVLGVFIVIGAIGAIFGNGENGGASGQPTAQSGGTIAAPSPAQSKEPEIEYIEVTATQLLQEFDENGVAAEAKYKGKVLKVTGTVGSIDKDILDNAFVTLTDDRNEYAIISVQCYFDEDSLDAIASLKPGDEITIVGSFSDHTMNVTLKKCSLAQN